VSLNALDVALVGIALMAAVGGWRLGLITRALSWAGMSVGLAVAARLVPSVATSTRTSASSGQTVMIALALLVGGAFLGQAVGLMAGNRLHLGVRSPTARRVDSIGGAIAGLVGILVAIWLVVPIAADVQGWPSRAVRQSRVARAVTDAFPAAPNATATMRRLLGDSYPQVFDALRPTPETGPPPAASGIPLAVSDRVLRSTVKVIGQACDRIQEGSGFVVGRGLVVTNAHVVAGERTTVLERSDGTRVDATVVAFDPKRDLAVLRAPEVDRPALPLDDASVGQRGAVYGHPGGGRLEISPFRVSERITAVGTDIYDRARTRRDVLVLAAALAPGDSGSALIDPQGEVIGVAFAIAPDRDGVAYALSIAELRPVLRLAGTAEVDTGRCVG